MDKYAVIVAGGRGLRMGGEVPKQFAKVGGVPVLMRTVRAFFEADEMTHIILVLPPSQHDYWATLCREHEFFIPHTMVSGGETRFHSVRNGLAVVPESVEAIVAVHDGVRPFVTPQVIDACFEVAAEWGTAVPVTEVVETVRRVSPNGNSFTVSREDYRLVQTPQAFRASLLQGAYRQPYAPTFTDDASVVEAMGREIRLVAGDRANIKLTTPEDMALAEYLCQSR